ncbi:MAG: glycosyltransferase family 9 protein, partial [Candidatus Aureabacteria bacterium]|nr:glycosyltransferase family 9 protein [Candidatus Auribacterota bacterium]
MKNPRKSRITKTDCRWYRGHIPCKPHKKTGCLCEGCNLYEPLKERILIIKLGAAGDVIRTTPLLRKLRSIYPHAEIVWLTYYPIFVPIKWVDKILSFNLKDITWLKAQEFSRLINLDKDDNAIALSSEIEAQKKTGFGMDSFGKCKPLSTGSTTRKWL